MNIERISGHRFAPALFRPRPLLIEAGTKWGGLVIPWLEQFPGGQAVCFEPCMTSRQRAKDALQHAGLMPRVVMREEALWHHGDGATFYEYSRPASHSLIQRRLDGETASSVPTATLAQVVRGAVDLLAMDIEGAEWQVLETCNQATFDQIKQISVELHTDLGDGNGDKTCALLRRAGYTVELEHQNTRRIDLWAYSQASPLRRCTNRWLRRLLAGKTFGTVLNAGCGKDCDNEGGTYANYFQGSRVINLDVKEGPGVDTVAPTEAIPLHDNSVDCVFANWVIYKTDVPKSLGEMARVLRPGGVVLLSYSAAAENIDALRAEIASRVEADQVFTVPYQPRETPMVGEVVYGRFR